MQDQENIIVMTDQDKKEIINNLVQCVIINNPQHFQSLNKIQFIQAKFKIKQQIKSYYQ